MGETLPEPVRRISRVRLLGYTTLLLACVAVLLGFVIAIALGADWIVEHVASSVKTDGS